MENYQEFAFKSVLMPDTGHMARVNGVADYYEARSVYAWMHLGYHSISIFQCDRISNI